MAHKELLQLCTHKTRSAPLRIQMSPHLKHGCITNTFYPAAQKVDLLPELHKSWSIILIMDIFIYNPLILSYGVELRPEKWSRTLRCQREPDQGVPHIVCSRGWDELMRQQSKTKTFKPYNIREWVKEERRQEGKERKEREQDKVKGKERKGKEEDKGNKEKERKGEKGKGTRGG